MGELASFHCFASIKHAIPSSRHTHDQKEEHVHEHVDARPGYTTDQLWVAAHLIEAEIGNVYLERMQADLPCHKR